jgi:hypothetical protein
MVCTYMIASFMNMYSTLILFRFSSLKFEKMCKKYIFPTRFQSQKDVPLCAMNTIPLFQKEK